MVSDFTTDSVYKPLGHDTATHRMVLNVHGGLLDEVHAWAPPMRALYDVIVDGVTAREQPDDLRDYHGGQGARRSVR